MDDAQYQSLIVLINERYPDAKVDQIGEMFGKTLQRQAFFAVLLSFIGMSIVVLIAFRSLVPAGAVVLAAFSDIVITAAIMNVIGIPLSLGTTAALLMLIGYSVDSDILLTTRVLKRRGKLDEKLSGGLQNRDHHDDDDALGGRCHVGRLHGGADPDHQRDRKRPPHRALRRPDEYLDAERRDSQGIRPSER